MYTLADIAENLGGELHGDADMQITGIGSPEYALPGQIVVAFESSALATSSNTDAVAVVVPLGLVADLPYVTVDKPADAFNKLLQMFAPKPAAPTGVSELASVHTSAVLSDDVSIAPFVVIEAGAVIGKRCRVESHCVVGTNARLGNDVVLHANVTLYTGVSLGNRVVIHSGSVIGGNGYGLYFDGEVLRRIPQLGGVIIEDDVEVGCNCCIDRATVGVTCVRRGTKLDNQVQIAHNCDIGENCILAGQSGIAGSSKIGNFATLAGQSGLGDHATIPDHVSLGAQCAVFSKQRISPGEKLKGNPAIPLQEYQRIQVLQRRLRELFRRVDKLEKVQDG